MPFSHPARLSCFPWAALPLQLPPPLRETPFRRTGRTSLKNKKYQQGLKALENRLPLEASKHFQECLSSQNLAESQKP